MVPSPDDPHWPDWWAWELEFTPHLLKRMVDRDFSEIDLRRMLEDATGLRPAAEPSRWIVSTQLAGKPWEVIVEPDETVRVVVVVTAYPLS